MADLPGYGYAKVPQALRRQWQELIGSYLKSRASLVGVVVIMLIADVQLALVVFLTLPALAIASVVFRIVAASAYRITR